MQIPGTYPLQPVDGGRLYFREFRDGMAAVVGVVDVPADTPLEHLMAARLNDRLWLDVAHAKRLAKRSEWPDECDASSLLTSTKWRGGGDLPDAFEVAIRATHLQHADPARRWVYVMGVLKQPVPVAKGGGLFDLTPGGVVRVSDEPFAGNSLGLVLREPLWGPEGKYGLATSMNPAIYDEWVVKDRETNARRDPMFAKFIERTHGELGNPPLVYTREEMEKRDLAIGEIVRAIVAEDEAETEARYAAKSKSSLTP